MKIICKIPDGIHPSNKTVRPYITMKSSAVMHDNAKTNENISASVNLYEIV